jgi:predicted ATP-binding protein involved in virulence
VVYPSLNPWYDALIGESNMFIHSFGIEGYKGFRERQLLNLDPHMNVIFGENGSGKSSILYAMMIALSWVPSRIRSISTNGSQIEIEDINNKETSASLVISCKTNENTTIEWSLHKTKKGYPASKKSDYTEVNTYAKSIQSKIAETDEQCSVPLIGMYPVTRAWLNFPSRIKKRHTFDLVSILENDQIWNADYKVFYEWFRDQDIIETKERINDKSYRDPSLEAVRNAIYTFIPGFSNIHFQAKNPKGLLVEKEGHGTFRIEQLSGGEQCLIAMVGDLARKLTIANPSLKNPLEGNGIICIDEVDLHLHPTWQYIIVERLKHTFTNCQFIISTHSPCIISHAKEREIIYLKDVAGSLHVSQGIDSYGKNVESIYQDYLQLRTIRPKEIDEKVSKIYQLMDTDIDAAETQLKLLQKEVKADTELEKLQLIIDRKRILGK